MGLSLSMKFLFLHFIGIFLLSHMLPAEATVRRHKFVLKETHYTRLCNSKRLLTVNGKFPGPTLYANQGDTIIVDVINKASENVTLHWHGVKQPRNPWSDGPEYITQCPIRPGTSFRQTIYLSEEIGTLWWHAHSDWSRISLHGLIVVYPKKKNDYPFPVPHAQIPIIIGEWWKADIATLNELLRNNVDPNTSDAFLINGQPGDLNPCSKSGMFELTVDHGKTYLFRMVNAVMNNIMFFKIANHNIIVVGSDGSYTKPFKSDYIAISPGQTIDFLLEANQQPNHYYMATKLYDIIPTNFRNTTATAILKYRGKYTPPSKPLFPILPVVNDTHASTNFPAQLKSLASKDHPINVPLKIDERMLFTLSMNTFPCPPNVSCNSPFGGELSASINNISYALPKIDILQAYYKSINEVYGDDFPNDPPFVFNYTADLIPRNLWTPERRTEVKVLEYNSTVEIVFQGTNVVAGIDHPMHLHGYSFYVVGWGLGNFDKDKDPLKYNLVDPPFQSTINVPTNGWTAIRFKADNPGVWLLHCHIEYHSSWGMMMTFIVKNGDTPDAKMLPPPRDMPQC